MRPLTRCCHSRLRPSSIPRSRTTGRQWASQNLSFNPSHTAPLWLVRRNHNASSGPSPPKAIVIGAGPAGIAVVGNLLEAIPRGKIVWIDRTFEAGTIGQSLRELPSYSPAGDYLEYARVLQTFQDITSATPPPNAITALEQLRPDMTCSLNYAADMLQFLSDGLTKHNRVEPVIGSVSRAVRDPKTKDWTVTLSPPQIPPSFAPDLITFTAPMLVYCTGTVPRTTHLPLLPSETTGTDTAGIERIDVEKALSPSRLGLLLPRDERRIVAVIGSGHAAVLVLRNLFRLAAISHRRLRIRWFTRSERLVYAERDPYYEEEDLGMGSAVVLKEGENGGGVDGETENGKTGGELRVTNEHTGLMGEAAWFARTQLEGERIKTSDAGAYITRIVLPEVPKGTSEKERVAIENEFMVREGHLEGVNHMVQCIGWERGRLPEVRPGLGPLRGPLGKPKRLVFNGLTGSFFPSGGRRDQVVGLFGAGSAFPESVATTQGWREPAISVWKFMKFVRKMVPRWVEATKRGYLMKGGDGQEAEGKKRFHQWY